ncbi:MAG: hypothetical protein KF708_20350, partial [Pirellulales bacterium]|nr:hypothetical protein [Pirellulales bacterium]
GGPGSGIRTVHTDGTGLSQLPFTVYYPHQIEVDPVNNKVYFGDVVGFNGLRRANYDGTGVETLATGIVVGEALDLDIAGNRIFYSHNEIGVDEHQLWSANLDGSDPLLLLTVTERPNDIELWNGQMYWSTQFGIHRANLDGTDATKVVTFDAGSPWGADGFAIVPEPSSIAMGGIGAAVIGAYGFVSRLRHKRNGKCLWHLGRRGLKGDGETSANCRWQVPIVGALAWLVAALGPIATADAASLYFTSDGSIKRANIDGSGLETLYSYPGGSGSMWVNCIDIDPATQKLYWYGKDSTHPMVLRSNLDGSGIEPVITTGLTSNALYGFAVDGVGGKLYMHQHLGANSNSSIYTANLDGTGLAKLPFTAYYATDIIPEPVSGKLYFHDNVFYQGIRRSNLDGTSVENLVVGDARGVGLALDLTASKLYYTDAATHQIFRSNLDGSGQELLLSLDHMPRDIELFDGQMYWMSQFGVYRANTDGTGMTQVLALSGANWGSNDTLVIYEAVPEPATVAVVFTAVPMLIVAEIVRRRRQRATRPVLA